MLEIASGAPRKYSRAGCIVWIVCILILCGSIIFAMKWCVEWSEELFEEDNTEKVDRK